jgi:hypothetical protein
MSSNCLLCKQELGALEIECNQTTHYDCRKCSLCESPVAESLVLHAIEHGVLPEHESCREKELLKAFYNEELPLTQAHLDKLNKWLLSKRHVEQEPTLEFWYSLLRDMQQVSVNVAIALKRAKDKITIKDTEQYRAHVEIASENAKQSKRLDEEKKIRLQQERDNPAIRNRRKAVEGMMAMGLSREVAESMVPPIGEVKQ